MAQSNISIFNARIDRSLTVRRLGKNGVQYEYLLPYGANPGLYFQDAIDVKSRKKKNTKYNNGKKPGQYQPVGDKRYFNYFQLKKMTPEQRLSFIDEYEIEVE